MSLGLRSVLSLAALAWAGCDGAPPSWPVGPLVPVCGPHGEPASTGFSCNCAALYYDSGSSTHDRCIRMGTAYDSSGQLYHCEQPSACGAPAAPFFFADCGPQAFATRFDRCVCVDGYYDTPAPGVDCQPCPDAIACQVTADLCGAHTVLVGAECVCDAGYYAEAASTLQALACTVCPQGARCTEPGQAFDTLEPAAGWKRSAATGALVPCEATELCSDDCGDHAQRGPDGVCRCAVGYSDTPEAGLSCAPCQQGADCSPTTPPPVVSVPGLWTGPL